MSKNWATKSVIEKKAQNKKGRQRKSTSRSLKSDGEKKVENKKDRMRKSKSISLKSILEDILKNT